MSDAATLPNNRDEDWRYSDVKALKALDLGTFEDWRDIEVAAGETSRECFVITDAGEDANVDPEGTHLTRLRVKVGDGGRCELFGVIAGGKFSRVEIVVQLGEGAHFELGGVTLGGRDTTREFVTRTAHEKPHGTSNQTIRAVHWGQGTGNFLGRIDVVRDAQKTDAAQSFKGLLLERGASANAVPQLEIYADDVKCEHGATVGQMDEMARYYMAARGIPPELSRKLLVRAFIGDSFVNLDDEAERDRLMDAALFKLEQHL